MEKQLSAQQIEEIKEAYLKDKLSIENQIIKLIVAGYEENRAEYLVNKVIKEYKEALFTKSKEDETNENEKKIADFIVIFIAAIGCVLSFRNPAWDLFVVIVAGIAGYLGYNAKPIAGMVRSIVLAGLFPIAFDFYFEKRSTYLNLELLIPFGISLLVAYMFQLLVSKIFYPEYD